MTDAPILLVEDNPDDVLLTRRAFAKNGFTNRIVALPDGEACIQALLPGPDPDAPPLVPAIVLLDINLPRVGGLDVLRRIRAERATSTLPVIMLTTSREQRDIAESYRLGANSFVRKPIAFSEFLAMVRILGVYWLRINEPSPAPR
ncbi:MAG TPA: response regulator [Actinocrinis sp.]|nr:response regulator [Actinocrinis sp.]